MNDDPFRPITGPFACPPWCIRIHPAEAENVSDGIMHTSQDITWDLPGNRHFPRIEFQLHALDGPQGRTAPALEVTAQDGEGHADEYEAPTRAELDAVVAELERTLTALRQWRTYLPAR